MLMQVYTTLRVAGTRPFVYKTLVLKDMLLITGAVPSRGALCLAVTRHVAASALG